MSESFFEKASRRKFRFSIPNGVISVEDLWDIPLVSSKSNGRSLDAVAVALSKEVKAMAEVESFVEDRVKKDQDLEDKFELVKHIISVRKAEEKLETERRENRKRKQQILALIVQKENEQLSGASLEELRAMAEAL